MTISSYCGTRQRRSTSREIDWDFPYFKQSFKEVIALHLQVRYQSALSNKRWRSSRMTTPVPRSLAASRHSSYERLQINCREVTAVGLRSVLAFLQSINAELVAF